MRSNADASNFKFSNQYCLHPELKTDVGMQVSCVDIYIIHSYTSINNLLEIWYAKANGRWIPNYNTKRNRQAMSLTDIFLFLLDQTSRHFRTPIKKLHGLNPRANYTDRAAAAGRRN